MPNGKVVGYRLEWGAQAKDYQKTGRTSFSSYLACEVGN